jgi:hypothetical protein
MDDPIFSFRTRGEIVLVMYQALNRCSEEPLGFCPDTHDDSVSHAPSLLSSLLTLVKLWQTSSLTLNVRTLLHKSNWLIVTSRNWSASHDYRWGTMYNFGFVRLLPQGEVFAWLELPCSIIVQIGIGIDKEVLICDSLYGFINYCHCEYAYSKGLRKSFLWIWPILHL